MYIYDRFKIIRKYFGLSQSQFAKAINRTVGLVSNVEHGRSGVSQETIKAICSTYGISESWLAEGIGEMFAEGCEVSEVDKENVGDRVKLIRKREKLTQAEFGESIGYCKMQVFSVENKKTMPSNIFLKSVANTFNVSYEWLLTGEGEMERTVEEAVVDDKLIEWLKKNPEVVKELRIRGGLD